MGRVEPSAGSPVRWPDAREMAVPASFNDIAADAAVRDHVGDVWYQRTVRVPRGWEGQRIVLHFESATHRATVWVDDAEVVAHEGGYTPFEADITDHVAPGQRGADHRAGQQHPALAVDPAGRHRGHSRRKTAAVLPRLLQLRRPPPLVWLYATNPAHVTDVTVVTDLDGADGVIDYAAEAEDADGARDQGRSCATPTGQRSRPAPGRAARSRVPDVHRWAPGDGYLYDLELQLVRRGHRRRQLSPKCRGAHRRGGRHPVPDQRRAVLLHGLRQARGHRR